MKRQWRPTQARAINKTELLWISIPLLIVLGLGACLIPPFVNGAKRDYCNNNIKGLMIGCLLYSGDFRFFPSVAAKNSMHTPEQVPRVFETLIYLRFADNPESLLCQMSDEKLLPLSPQVKNDPRLISLANGDQGIYKAGPVNPALRPLKESIFDNDYISYTYMKSRVIASSVPSNRMIIADKAARRSERPSIQTLLQGSKDYHHAGYNVGLADGSTRLVKPNDKKLMAQMLKELILKNSQGNTKKNTK